MRLLMKKAIAPPWDDPSFAHRFREVTRLFRRVFHKEIQRFGITDGEWACLRALWDADGISQTELSARLDMTGAAIALWINVLERDGLAKRINDPGDKRKLLIYLTPKGRNAQKLLQPSIRSIHQRVFSSFSDAEIDQLRNMLARIEDSLKAHTTTPDES
jgi:DNA-binding MarR family transcriptional regulator